MHMRPRFRTPTATPSETNNHDLFTIFNVCHESRDTVRYIGQHSLERPYAFRDTPIRPLSIAIEQDTRAYVKQDRYELSLDLWRMPSAGNQRPAMGIDLWSLMIGMDF